MRYRTISRFCAESGYTDAAVRGKIRDGVWLEGRVWRRAPDGHVLIDVRGYEEWVENQNGLACDPQGSRASKLTSGIGAFGAGKNLSSSPPPLT